MYRKARYTSKPVVLLNKPIAVLTISLLSSSLKLASVQTRVLVHKRHIWSLKHRKAFSSRYFQKMYCHLNYETTIDDISPKTAYSVLYSILSPFYVAILISQLHILFSTHVMKPFLFFWQKIALLSHVFFHTIFQVFCVIYFTFGKIFWATFSDISLWSI